MYHIRRVDDHDERSLHMESDVGLRHAVSEAYLRTHHTGALHEIVNDNGELVYVTELKLLLEAPPSGEEEIYVPVTKPAVKPVPWLSLVCWAYIAATLLHMVASRR